MIHYRAVSAPEDLSRVVDLEIAVWGLSERDALPVNILSVFQHIGGMIGVAEDSTNGALVGFSMALPMKPDSDQLDLWSHAAGVHPDYQGLGIGAELKFFQRQWALEHGFSAIRWTFDPLKAANANFNLNHLRAVPIAYRINLYGVMRDALNVFGLPSDRLEIRWPTEPSQHAGFKQTSDDAYVLLNDLNPILQPFPNPLPEQIIIHLPEMLPEQVGQWQLAIREAFQWGFTHDYQVVGFERHSLTRGIYQLARIG